MLARALGPEGFGTFSSAWAAAQLILPLAVFGIPRFLLHRFEMYGSDAGICLSPAFRSLGITGIAAASCYVLWILSSADDNVLQALGWMFAVWILLSVPVVTVYAIYQIERNVRSLVLWPLLQIFPRTVVAGAVFVLGVSAVGAGTGYVVVLLPLSLWSAWRMGQWLSTIGHFGWRVETLTNVFKGAAPYGISEALDRIDLKAIVPLVAVLANERQAGYVAVVVSILQMLYLIPSALFQRYWLPYLHRWQGYKSTLTLLFLRARLIILAAAGLVSALIIVGVSSPIIDFIYGEKFAETVASLNVSVLALPMLLGSAALTYGFITESEVRLLSAFQITAFLIMVLIAIILVPTGGAVAGAWAFVASRSILFLLMLLAFLKWRRY